MPRGTSIYDEARLQGRLWTLALIPSSVGWWDPSDLANSIRSSSGFAQLTDKSGKGQHLTQTTTSAQPLVATRGVGGPTCMSFTGSQYIYRIGQTSWNNNIGSQFAVVDPADTSPSGSVYVDVTANGTRNYNIMFDNGYFVGGDDQRGGSDYFPYQSGDRTASQFGSIQNLSAASLYQDGVLQKSDNSSMTLYSSADTFTVGGLPNATYLASNTLIGEIFFMNTVATTSQRLKIEGYLAWRWKLVGKLPSSHPFKNRPPLIGD